MLYLYLDTNVFLHCKHFEEIDWPELTDRQEPFTITIAPIIIDELDKHKYSQQRRRSQKVKSLLPRLEAILENPELCRLRVKTSLQRPPNDVFSQYNLDKSQADDCLLASILYDKQQQPSNEFLLVSIDTGPRLKAMSLQISTIKPADKFLLPNEPDELEKETNRLKNELNLLKNVAPDIELAFSNKTRLVEIKVGGTLKSKEQFIEEQMQKIKQQYPTLQPTSKVDPYQAPLFSVGLNSILGLSDEQVNRYNKSLEDFFAKFIDYFECLYKKTEFQYNSACIELILVNVGNAPANDIDINLHFPDGFDMYCNQDIPKTHKEPNPPYKPKHSFDFEPLNLGILPAINPQYHTQNVQLKRPTIKKTNSYNVEFHEPRLKHNQEISLDVLYARYADIRKAKGFNIDYKITVGNIPKPITGQLQVKFTFEV